MLASDQSLSSQARAIFRALLGREPESDHSLALVAGLETVERMASSVGASDEHILRVVTSPGAREAVAAAAFVNNAVVEQVRAWEGRRISRVEAEGFARHLNATEFWACVFEIRGNRVNVLDNPPSLTAGKPPNLIGAYNERALNFQKLLTDALDEVGVSLNLDIVVYLGDEAEDFHDFPVFSFQKNVGGVNLLLPDFEIVGLNYLAGAPTDPNDFAGKSDRAVFAGSTTGGGAVVRLENVLDDSNFQRLKAARDFIGRAEVDFRLPAIVQCTADAEAALRREGFGSNPMYWPESFENKFIISLDGNGATCSRPGIILKSQSVLLKYHSKFTLFWTSALVPWLHYIPIFESHDVIHVVQAERERPGRFSHIAEEGRRFADAYLSRPSVLRYTASLLVAYNQLLT